FGFVCAAHHVVLETLRCCDQGYIAPEHGQLTVPVRAKESGLTFGLVDYGLGCAFDARKICEDEVGASDPGIEMPPDCREVSISRAVASVACQCKDTGVAIPRDVGGMVKRVLPVSCGAESVEPQVFVG